MSESKVDQKILQKRFQFLGWTMYRLAQEVAKVRTANFNEEPKKAASLVTTVAKVIDNPNTSSFKNVETAIKAMGGEIVIRWPTVEPVVTGHEEIKL